MSSDIDTLIVQKVNNFREYLISIVDEKYKNEITNDGNLDISKLELFKLFILMGGTYEKFYDIIKKKYGLTDDEKVLLYCKCLFDLLIAKNNL